ncbi:MAG TPA: DUF4124 domain-containing protein [Gammaproteobacteria bacterium]|nr:DUF4124 domain-containing protein [Gammaproteobacteria bacterium]
MKRILLAVALLLVAASALAGVYRWVDKNGVVHYTDTPPPQGAHAMTIQSGPGDAAAAKARQAALDKRLENYDKQQQKAAAATAKDEQKQQKQARACQAATHKYQRLTGIFRMQLHMPDGSTKYISGEDLSKYREKLREQAAKLCGDAAS